MYRRVGDVFNEFRDVDRIAEVGFRGEYFNRSLGFTSLKIVRRQRRLILCVGLKGAFVHRRRFSRRRDVLDDGGLSATADKRRE